MLVADALEGLDPEQRAAALEVAGPVCIIAGAGTGKTRTVTHRLAQGVSTGAIDPRHALAITHSKKAAAELRGRLGHLGVQSVDARTFHSAGLRVASEHWALTGRPEPAPGVMSEREEGRLWGDAIRRAIGRDPDKETFRDVRDDVAWARSSLLSPEAYARVAQQAGRGTGLGPATVARCWELFTSAKTKAGRLDFADLVEIAASLIEQHSSVAEAVRQRWAHVTVDEYQDTDPAQQRLLDAIMGDGRDDLRRGGPSPSHLPLEGGRPLLSHRFPRPLPRCQGLRPHPQLPFHAPGPGLGQPGGQGAPHQSVGR